MSQREPSHQAAAFLHGRAVTRAGGCTGGGNGDGKEGGKEGGEKGGKKGGKGAGGHEGEPTFGRGHKSDYERDVIVVEAVPV